MSTHRRHRNPAADKDRPRTTPAQLMALVNRAIADGMHSATYLTACSGCDRWVDKIWYTPPGTRRRLCPDCADLMGKGPKTDLAVYETTDFGLAAWVQNSVATAEAEAR